MLCNFMAPNEFTANYIIYRRKDKITCCILLLLDSGETMWVTLTDLQTLTFTFYHLHFPGVSIFWTDVKHNYSSTDSTVKSPFLCFYLITLLDNRQVLTLNCWAKVSASTVRPVVSHQAKSLVKN